MSKVLLRWVATLMLWASAMAVAQTSLPAPVAQALANAGIPEGAVSVYVQEVDGGRPAVSFGADRALNPASTIKLVTTYAALDLLGPAYTWNTEVYASGALQREVLNGNLLLKGYGDPKLTLENFWLLLRNVRARGVRDIRGELVLDRSYFAREDNDPSRFDDQPTRPYNTPPDALLVNYKAITVQFVPETDGKAVRLLVEPALPAVQVVGNVVATDGPCGDWVSRLKIEPQGNGAVARLAISGPYPRDCGERTRSFSLLSHPRYVGALFGALWQELGGSYSGTVREDTVDPSTARLLATAKSPTLSEVVRDINKFSNNVMARQLYLTLGGVSAGAPATLEKARAAVQTWLAQKRIDAPELVLENGSGLSRAERISARTMARLLLDAYRSPVMPEFIASLPLVAVDGTMRKRLGNAGVAGRAHIKTGTLTGVRAIAGYVLDARDVRHVVVFMVNHPNAAAAQAAQDALLKWVYDRDVAVATSRRKRDP
ncbi:MAG: D-alanyl-D-alanine carboxypeptidase/D-alanyl-D-alanine-endopeptidase [Rhodospirillaceae bacterium]